jgi:hypothetical protein
MQSLNAFFQGHDCLHNRIFMRTFADIVSGRQLCSVFAACVTSEAKADVGLECSDLKNATTVPEAIRTTDFRST